MANRSLVQLTDKEEHLEIGACLSGTIYKGVCRGILTRFGIKKDVTVFIFQTKNAAKGFVQQLEDAKTKVKAIGKDCSFLVCVHFVKAFIKTDGKKEKKGYYVITEPLSKFDANGLKILFNHKSKHSWHKESKTTLRLGDGPKELFREVGKAMYALNEAGLFSNKIMFGDDAIHNPNDNYPGIWFESDLRLRLSNCKCFNDEEHCKIAEKDWIDRGLKEDVLQYTETLCFKCYLI